jgi:two-component system, LytTR family, response regulator
MIKVLIIEDEIKTARELQKNIETSPFGASVVNIVQSIKGAVKWLNENDAPDLIFSDIQLADGLSFEIFDQVEIKSPIIFCTAHNEYAIEAFKTASIDYLLKPIDEIKLTQSLEKYHQMKTMMGATSSETIKTNLQQVVAQFQSTYKATLLVHYQEKIIPLKITQIAYIHYELGNVYIVTFEQKKYYMNQTLDEFEAMLNPEVFFRANRQFIINKNIINIIENYFSRRLLLQLNIPTPEPIIVSKTKAPQLLKWIENN